MQNVGTLKKTKINIKTTHLFSVLLLYFFTNYSLFSLKLILYGGYINYV